MKTSSIAYRVADFLKRHPPFEFFSEQDLLELAASGRVKFHETDEYVQRQGEDYSPYVFAIQQGRVDLLDETAEREVLRDVLGEGDILGVHRLIGYNKFAYSARTASDVILYALDGDLLAQLIDKYPRASRYISAYFSVRESFHDSRAGGDDPLRRRASWLDLREGVDDVSHRNLITLQPDDPLRVAAEQIADRRVSAALVVDIDGAPLGLVGAHETLGLLASGRATLDTPAKDAMHLGFGRDEAGLSAGHYLLTMMRGGTRWVATTTGRRTRKKVVGLLSQSDLNALHGENPVPIVERIRTAESVAELRRWNERARSLIVEGLTDRSDVRWYAEIATEFNRAVLGRCIELAEQELATSGHQPPAMRSCWLFFGSAARRELLTAADLDFGLVHENPRESDRQAVEEYFEKLCLWVVGAVESAGFTFAKSAIRPDNPRWRQSIAGWTSSYAGWIEDPILNRIYEGRPFFDLTPAYGHLDVAERLQENLGLLLKENPDFVPLLAVDSFGNLPPLTFYQGLVVDDSGAGSDSLDLRRSLIYPLVDVARVFGLAHGSIERTSTIERLATAKSDFPAHSTLLDEASDAVQVALYHRAHSGLRNNSDGSIVATESLSRLDQQLLKNAFRTVLELMRFGAEVFNIRPRA